ncbi:uncharacterized [Tachysurus ichikawai]
MGGVRNCFSSSVTPIDVCLRMVPFGTPKNGPLGVAVTDGESTDISWLLHSEFISGATKHLLVGRSLTAATLTSTFALSHTGFWGGTTSSTLSKSSSSEVMDLERVDSAVDRALLRGAGAFFRAVSSGSGFLLTVTTLMMR